MIPTFDEYINEKMGVLVRENVDDSDVSRVVNSFMDKISKDPKKDFESTETFFDKQITIRYNPQYFGEIKPGEGGGAKGEAGRDTIIVNVGLTESNYLDIKYIIAHELVHILQRLRSKYMDSFVGKRQMLIYPSFEELFADLGDKSLSSFIYMMYRNVPFEIYAWTNQGYVEAFKYKLKYPDKSNQSVVKHVLNHLKMSNDDLNKSLDSIKNNKTTFEMIISVLIGQFSEISKNNMENYRYFDKSIFKLPIIKTMRKEVVSLLSDDYKRRSFSVYIGELIGKYLDELEEYREPIIDSFIKSFEYWFNKSKQKLGKAISLGIEDATME